MHANIAQPAALIGEPPRAAMLLALLDGGSLSAAALACAAGLTPQGASNHLAKLAQGGLVSVARQGRRRLYRLAGPEVARAVEALSALGPLPPRLDPPLSAKARRLRQARTCYDHLAGRLGVALAEALERDGLVEPEGPDRRRVTPAGVERLSSLGLAFVDRRSLSARPCLDWTERRPHLAGPLGSKLLQRLFELGWITRGAEPRSIEITAAGRSGFKDRFGIELDAAGG